MKTRHFFVIALGLCVPGGTMQAENSHSELKVLWNGSGCPQSEDHIAVDAGKALATRDVSSGFVVKRGKGARLSESRKNCAAIVSSEGSSQVALEKITWTGSGTAGASAKVELAVDVSGEGTASSKTVSLDRGAGDNFSATKTLGESEKAWSGCGRALTVNAKERIEAAGEASLQSKQLAYVFAVRP